MLTAIILLCATNFASQIQRVQGHEWQAYEEIKTAVRKSIAEKKQFEKIYESLEYTALNIQEYIGDSDKVLKFCSEVLGMHDSTDVVSVIEVIKKVRSDDISLMSDIMTCLLNNTLNDGKEEFETEKVWLKVRKMRGKDVYGFGMLCKNVETKYNLTNYIRGHLIQFTYARLEISIKTYINEFAIKIITKQLMQKIESTDMINLNSRQFESNSLKFGQIDYSKLKCEVIKEITKKNFIKYARKNVAYSVSTISESDSFKNFVDELGIEINDFLNKSYEKKYDDIQTKDYESEKPQSKVDTAKSVVKIQSQILSIYNEEIKNMLKKAIKDGLVICIRFIRNAEEHQFTDAYKDYVSWLTQKIESSVIVPHTYKADKLIEIYKLSQGEDELKLPGFMKFYGLFCRVEYKDSQILNDIDSFHDSNRLRIVLNEQLTKDNLHFLSRILNNAINSRNIGKSSIVFINMRHGIDFFWDLDDENKLILKIKDKELFYTPREFGIYKCEILKKVNGKYIYRSSAVGELFSYGSKIPNSAVNNRRIKMTYKIKNLVRHIDITKSVKINMNERNGNSSTPYWSSILRYNREFKVLKVVISSNTASFYLDIKFYKDKGRFELVRTYKFNPKSLKKFYIYDLESIYHDQAKKNIYSKGFLPNLIKYLRITTLSSFNIDLQIMAQFLQKRKYCQKIKFSVTTNLTTELDVLVPIKLEKIQTTIGDYYKEKGDTKIARLKILSSDFLQRESNTQKWKDLTRQFLLESCMNEKMLCDAINESTFVQAKIYVTNEDGILGLNAHNYEIFICAIIRNEHKTIVYLTKRDFYFDFKHITMSEMMDIYVRLLNDETYLEKAHPLNYLHITSHTIAHPLSYIFKTLSNFGSNLLEMIEYNSCYEYKPELYKEMSTLVAQNIHADIPIGYYIGKVYSVKRNLKTCYIRSAEIILEKEIYEVVRMIKEHYEKMRSHANLILAIVSLDGLDSSDHEEIEDLRKKIKQEL